MLLYHSSTAYHVLCAVVHKLCYHREDDAVLMITEYLLAGTGQEAVIGRLKKAGWFEDIIIIPERQLKKDIGKRLNESSTRDEIEEVLDKTCEVVKDWSRYRLEDFNDIYVSADIWSVPVYLIRNRLKYHYIEDASGMLGEERRYLKLLREINAHNYVVCEYLQAAGRNKMVIDKLCDIDNQPEGFFDNKAIDFSIYKTMKKLDAKTRKEIIRLYDGEIIKENIDKKRLLFLTQYHNNLEIQSILMQRKMTTLLIDYFAKDYEVIVKSHPKDRYLPYENIINGSMVIKNSVPSELIPFVVEGKIDLVITPNSTSVGGMKNTCDRVMSFGEEIETEYEKLHLYYAAAYITDSMISDNDEKIIVSDNQKNVSKPDRAENYSINTEYANEIFAKNFLELFGLDKYIQNEENKTDDFSKGKVKRNETEEKITQQNMNLKSRLNKKIFWDSGWNSRILKSEREKFGENDCIFFLEEENLSTFLMYPWVTKEKLAEIEITVVNSEYSQHKRSIWFYGNDERLLKKVRNMAAEKKLENSDITIMIKAKEAVEKRMLEGKLKALEFVIRRDESEITSQVLSQASSVIEQYKANKHFVERIMEPEEVLPHI